MPLSTDNVCTNIWNSVQSCSQVTTVQCDEFAQWLDQGHVSNYRVKFEFEIRYVPEWCDCSEQAQDLLPSLGKRVSRSKLWQLTTSYKHKWSMEGKVMRRGYSYTILGRRHQSKFFVAPISLIYNFKFHVSCRPPILSETLCASSSSLSQVPLYLLLAAFLMRTVLAIVQVLIGLSSAHSSFRKPTAVPTRFCLHFIHV